MSTEQPESAHSHGETQAAPPLQSNNLQGEITQQATSPTPTTKRAKNPKRVAASKLVTERTRKAREAQKKAAAEASAIIAKNKAPAPLALATEDESPRNILSTTQWLAADSLFVSLTSLTGKKPRSPSKKKRLFRSPRPLISGRRKKNEKRLPTFVKVRYLYQPGEGNDHRRATDPIWSLKVYSIERSFTKHEQPVLYYLRDGPKRGFVREELLVIPPNTELPPEKL